MPLWAQGPVNSLQSGGTAVYAQDSFFTLTLTGQVGLAALSGLLAALWLWLTRRLARHQRRLVRLTVALALFWAFLWLSPQIYYTYYRLIIDGLPNQIVIGLPPGPGQMLRTLLFLQAPTLSSHSAGLLGWAMLAVAAIMPQRSELTRT